MHVNNYRYLLLGFVEISQAIWFQEITSHCMSPCLITAPFVTGAQSHLQIQSLEAKDEQWL